MSDSAIYYTLLSVNILLSGGMILAHKNMPYSLHKIVNIFILIFFLFANVVHYCTHSVVVPLDYVFTDGDYVKFQTTVLLISVVYNGVYELLLRRRSVVGENHCDERCYSLRTSVAMCLSIAAIVFLLVVFRFNVMNLVLRGGPLTSVSIFSKSTTVMMMHFIRPVAMMCFVCALMANVKLSTKIVLFILMLISLVPTSITRYGVGLYWVPVAIMLFPVLRKPYVLSSVLILGLFFVFPLFDNFRGFAGELSLLGGLDYINTINYDVGQEFMMLTKEKYMTGGIQLLGLVFFFIPRALWPAKPVGSGTDLIHNVAPDGGVWANVPVSYWGEGYINFGYVGILLFTVVLALFTIYMDKRYWSHAKQTEHINSKFDVVYLIVLGGFLFLMRGGVTPLASTLLALICFLCVSLLCLKKAR